VTYLRLDFIRDPDDPTFHPVRDVLERSVSTQLWKISFSALVYGGLVIICLGGVVRGIAYTFVGVLPIQWSSNEPVLEFPVDLLFYNFLMPLAVKFFKPSKGLKKIYTWWFRKCARALRLTNFLFGDKKEDEEGRHVSRTWTSNIDGVESRRHSSDVVESSYTIEGRYVRAPGSDQVRIPKDARSFLEVDKDNNRVDGLPDPDDGLHGRKNELFTTVYVPPKFRIRISAFILLIWLFAAATGISMTIVPLVFGRFIFAQLAPSHLMNDIYAFSIGVYILGAALYATLHLQSMAAYFRNTLTPHTTTIASFLHRFASLGVRFLSLIYTYTAFGMLLPALLSLLMEFYLIIPLHTYFSTTFTPLDTIQSERHIIHIIQDWTLGVLYLKMAARIILWNTPSRPATALRAIVRNGWLNPDARLATRGFIVPAVLAMSFALAAPLTLAWLANATILRAYSAQDAVFKACVYRYSYPGVLAVGFAAAFAWVLAKAFTGWRKKVRDEVYLIGERLHNFGEARRRRGGGKEKGKGRAEAAGVGLG
jgi:E3 ubiquitin-protein ligase MARCH6